MPEITFFPQRPASHPMIYAYEDTNPQYKGLLKVGYTSVDVDKRVAQQYPTKRPDGSVPYEPVCDRLDVFLQSPQLCRVRQAKGLEA